MANAEVSIIIKATDKASTALKGINSTLGKFKTGLTDSLKQIPGVGNAIGLLTNPLTLATAGIGAMTGALIKSVTETQKYALSMGDLSKVWNTSVEEASKLVQVADDVRISQEQLSASMRIAMRQGIEPTIAGIKEAAEKYQSFTNTQERATWASKTFGRQWTEISRLLELAPEQIDASAEAAERLGLVMSEKNVKAAEDFYAATDNLQDSLKGLEYTVGNEVIPILTKYAQKTAEIVDVNIRAEQTEKDMKAALDAGLITRKQYKVAMDDVFTSAVFGKINIEELAEAEEYLRLNVSRTGAEMSIGMGDLRAYEAGIRTNTEAADENAQAQSRVALSITEVSKTSAAKQALDILTQAYKEGTISQDVYNVKASDIMRNWLKMPDSQITASIALQNIQQDFENGTVSALNTSSAILAVGKAINAIPKEVNIKINTIYTESGKPVKGSLEGRRQHGGFVRAGKPYLVGEGGEEIFMPDNNGHIMTNAATRQIMNTHNWNLTINEAGRVVNPSGAFAMMRALAG